MLLIKAILNAWCHANLGGIKPVFKKKKQKQNTEKQKKSKPNPPPPKKNNKNKSNLEGIPIPGTKLCYNALVSKTA
jgi:DNA replication protein DnaD